MRLADETIILAVDIAAATVLALNDKQLAKNAAIEAQAAIWGAKEEPEVEWEEVTTYE
jgi:hypothetical protein